MCFSATASFTSGIVLGTIGVVTVKNSPQPHHKPFAIIPLIFAFQQFTEGFLWLALKGKIDPAWEHIFTHSFITIAQVVWPFWVPFSISLLEQNPKRKKIFYFLIAIGCMISLSIAYRLLFYPAYSTIEQHHISYHLAFPVTIHYLGAICYCIVILAPPFVSSVKRMHLLGTFAFVSFIAAEIFYTKYVISVWCFFAAIISVAVYIVIKAQKKSHEELEGYKISDYQL